MGGYVLPLRRRSSYYSCVASQAQQDPCWASSILEVKMTRRELPTFLYSLAGVAGSAAAYNFVSLFNPANSGKALIPSGVFVSSTSASSSSVAAPLRGYRISAASGGTLQATSSLVCMAGHLDGTFSVAEVRIDNPTCTIGSPIFSSPALQANNQVLIHDVELPTGTPPFTLNPGQGVVLRTISGTANITWNMTLVWSEA